MSVKLDQYNSFLLSVLGNRWISCLDLLSTTGLVNYFGKWSDLTNVDISPLLLRKGETRLALYGLSHIKDDRLARLFRDGKVMNLNFPVSEKMF